MYWYLENNTKQINILSDEHGIITDFLFMTFLGWFGPFL